MKQQPNVQSNKKTAEVRNFYKEIGNVYDPHDNNPNYDVHGIKVPFRMLIIGSTGSMKTNSALDVVSKFSGTFVKIIVICRNKDEPLYKHMEKKIPKDQFEIIEIPLDDLSKLPSIEDHCKEDGEKLVIFDDLCLIKKQRPIEEFFIRARKVGISCMYLTQGYTATPLNIRRQCDYIIFKKIETTDDLKRILRQYRLGISIEQLQKLYYECTSKKLNWLMIKSEEQPMRKFWKNYDCIDGIVMDDGDENHPIEFEPEEEDEDEQPKKKQKTSDEESGAGEESDDDAKIKKFNAVQMEILRGA